MSVQVTAAHLSAAEALVERAHRNGGLAPVDLERFWADQRIASANPFGADIPQVAFGAACNGECVFEELGIPQNTSRYQSDSEWRLALNREYNDRAEQTVGRRLLDERQPGPARRGYPKVKELYEIFEMENRWDDISQSYWLHQAVFDEDELSRLLDRVEARLERLREFLLPPGWDDVHAELMAEDVRPPLYRGQRGPVTFAMSLFGVEGIIYLIADRPKLAARLRDAILNAMLGKIRIHDAEAGYTAETKPRGFSFLDDNCAMLNVEMYEFFGYPIVKGVWDECSPDPKDSRYQHSDSDMEHLLPVLARCRMTGVNFGPNVMADDIRRHMPEAVIYGVLAPFTYSRNQEVNIVAEFLRDHERTRDSRGLVFATAGSINNGSRLTGMRLIMSAIQQYGRFDA